MPPSPPTLAELTAAIRTRHSEVEAALVTAVVPALALGKALVAAKAQVGHGNFEDYVTIECHFTVRTAQNYMRLARYEPEVRQLLARKSEGRAYLTMGDALKFVDKLSKKNPRKNKSKPTT
jgi:Protein of unknown function (DUF3102)